MSQFYSPSQSPAGCGTHPGERLASSEVPLSNRFNPLNRPPGSGPGRGSARTPRGSSRTPQGSGTRGSARTPQGSRTQQSPRAPQASGTPANSSRAKGNTAASRACQQDINDTSEVGWGAPPVPVIDPLLDWGDEPCRSPPPESFIGAGQDQETGFEHQSKTRSSSDEERLPDPLNFTWDAAPTVPNLAQAVGSDLVSQVQAQMNFSESSRALANRLFAATGEERWRLTVVMFVHLMEKPTTGPVVNTLPSAVNRPLPFTFSNHIKCFLRDKLRLILTKGHVDAYTRTMTVADSTPYAKTPLLLLKGHLQSQDASFHKDYLPPGYPTNIEASVKVVKLMRGFLKTEKGLFRTLLLCNIKEQNHQPINGAVPNLETLIVYIDQHMVARKQLRSSEAILRSYEPSVKTRLAFLRLYIVTHLIHRDPTDNTTNWELIDQQLEYVRSQTEVYRIAYDWVVEAIDKELFGQKKKFEDIPHEDIRVPTEEDVQEELIHFNSPPPLKI
ncbi:hypothetical protein PGT21_019377 [Puccinia graminis f. sp. tritici]|uniref:Uncharacterized protein n=1 Tax=Puccinia graminis f. sp. tritici TaxID=56615 RepID=A0A5B0MPB1_PUCGR|nr:hypothetical protein PGT21_019377 [Puccinia graminis f. sp. tritici]